MVGTTTQREQPCDEIVKGFERRLDTDPDLPMVVGPEHSVTAADIESVARNVASSLDQTTLPTASIVALRCPNGPSFLSGLLAIRRAGCVALLIDSTTPDDALQTIVESLGVAAVLTSASGWTASFTAVKLTNGPRAVLPDAGYIKLTSGSTGTPRGIVVPAAALAADSTALGKTMGFGAGDRLLATLPMSHSYGLSVLAVPALMLGTVLIDPAGSHPLREARRHEARVFPTVPCHLQALLGDNDLEWPESTELVITAGEPTSPTLAREFHHRTGRKIHVFYGASECGGITYDRTGDAALRGTVGVPIDGVTIHLGATEADSSTTVRIQSAAVAHGYHPTGQPRLRDGIFITDDLGRWEENELVLSGRTSRWINVRGKKVDPLEVEGIIRELRGVNEVVVLREQLSDRPGEALQAVIATRDDLSYMDVRDWCRDRLASHKTPRKMIFVKELPRNARGKIDRQELQRLATER